MVAAATVCLFLPLSLPSSQENSSALFHTAWQACVSSINQPWSATSLTLSLTEKYVYLVLLPLMAMSRSSFKCDADTINSKDESQC